jgi:hypothetical protein
MFPDPVIQQKKLAMLGLAGALGNVLGLLLAGVAMLENYQWVESAVWGQTSSRADSSSGSSPLSVA